MRALLSLFLVIIFMFSSLCTTCSVAKTKQKSTTEVTDSIVEGVNSNKKSTKTKTKKVKTKQQKVKKEKQVSNVTDTESTTIMPPLPSTNKKEKKVKEKKIKEKKVKEKKVKPKKEKNNKSSQNSGVPASPAYAKQKQPKKRTWIGLFLNPNLDVYEIRASHILVKKRKDAVNIRKDILSGQITFEEAAKRYSLCPSGPYGGDLGYFNRRKMDQLFTDIAFDLKIGEISDPVGTKFGWHLIKVVDKR